MPGSKFPLILALICASLASFLIYRTIQEKAQPKVVEVPKGFVVYAKTTIPARTVITSDKLENRSIPLEAISKDSAKKFEEVVGFTAKSEIIAGEPINLNRVFKEGDDVSLAFSIPAGMRAITIAVDEVVGVAGFIKPSERVDVIGTISDSQESVTWTIIQDVEVLAVSQDMGTTAKEQKNKGKDEEVKVGTSVTIAVTPYQAQKIALADEKGVLRLTLRPALTEQEQKIPPLKEKSLIPPVSSGYSAVKKAPSTRKIEIISGGKSQYVTVF